MSRYLNKHRHRRKRKINDEVEITVIARVVSFIKRQEKPFKVNLFRASLQYFFVSLTQRYQPIYIVGLGADYFQLGLASGIGGIAGAVISLPTGWLADKHGIRRMFLVGTPLVALGSLIFALSPNWLTTIPALLITILALQILMTVCPMVCGSYLKTKERATGMQLCDTLSAIPGIISPIIGAIIITEFGGLTPEGIKPLYLLQAIGFLLIFFVILRYYRDTVERRVSSRLGSETKFLENMRKVLARGKNVKRWILYRALSDTSWYVGLTYLPLFVAEVKGADQFVLGGMTTASMILPLLLSIPMGWLADTAGRKKVIYIVTPLYALSILLLISATNTTTLLISGFLQGFFMLGLVTQGAMSQEFVPTYLLGTWWGVLSLFGPVFVFILILSMETSKITLLWLSVPETLKMKSI